MVQPVYGAKNCSGAGSEAFAARIRRCIPWRRVASASEHLRDRRLLLADGDVDTEDIIAFFVDDGLIATAVLPVWRWPDDRLRVDRGQPEPWRQMAFKPVCNGSCTLSLMMPGALI